MKIIATLAEVLIMAMLFAHCAVDSEFQARWWQYGVVAGLFLIVFIVIWR